MKENKLAIASALAAAASPRVGRDWPCYPPADVTIVGGPVVGPAADDACPDVRITPSYNIVYGRSWLDVLPRL